MKPAGDPAGFFMPGNRGGPMPRRFDRSYGSQFIRAFTTRGDDWTREAPGSEIPFTASTGAVAKDKMSLRPDRWRVENYHRSGGPVLWQHDHTRPAIGNGRAAVEPKRLRIHVAFDQEDEFARAIESKLRRRVLRSSSVGWNFVDESGEVLVNQRISPQSLANYAWQSLDEMSVVNVGSDPFAIAERAAYTAHALRSISPTFAELYEMQEREDSDVTGPELRRALIDYCERLGLDLRHIRKASNGYDAAAVVGAEPEDDDELRTSDEDDMSEDDEEEGDEDDEPGLVRRSQLPELLRAHGIEPNTSAHTEAMPTVSTVSTVDERAAQTILSAFAIHR